MTRWDAVANSVATSHDRVGGHSAQKALLRALRQIHGVRVVVATHSGMGRDMPRACPLPREARTQHMRYSQRRGVVEARPAQHCGGHGHIDLISLDPGPRLPRLLCRRRRDICLSGRVPLTLRRRASSLSRRSGERSSQFCLSSCSLALAGSLAPVAASVVLNAPGTQLHARLPRARPRARASVHTSPPRRLRSPVLCFCAWKHPPRIVG